MKDSSDDREARLPDEEGALTPNDNERDNCEEDAQST